MKMKHNSTMVILSQSFTIHSTGSPAPTRQKPHAARVTMVTPTVRFQKLQMKRLCQILTALAIGASMTGCASTRGYFIDRGRDARDAFILTAGVGLGMGADVRLGALSHPSIGIMTVQPWTFGFYGRDIPRKWDEDGFYWPATFVLCNGLCEGSRNCFNSSYSRCMHLPNDKAVLVDEQFLNIWNHDDPASTTLRKGTQIEVGVSAVIVSVRAGVNLLEFVDFLLGWISIDIFNDDVEEKQRRMTIDQDREPHR